jgi:quercetin dioxygenase-like cupin family protein
MKNRIRAIALGSVLAGLTVFGLGLLQAQQAQPTPAVKRNVLLKQDMTIPGREVVMAAVEIPAGGAEGKHTHPAEVFVFVEEGTIQLEVEGKPTVTLKAGDIFTIAPGQVHQASNTGTTPARLKAVFVAEKGKPLTTQVP